MRKSLVLIMVVISLTTMCGRNTAFGADGLRFTSGWGPDGKPLPTDGLRVRIGGAEYVTDVHGEVAVYTTPREEVVTFQDDWHLPRTTFAEPGRSISVLPVAGVGYDAIEAQAFFFGILYSNRQDSAIDKVPPGGDVVVLASLDITERPIALGVLKEAVRKIRTHGVSYAMASEGGVGAEAKKPVGIPRRADFPVDVVVDSLDPFLRTCPSCLALAYRYHDGPNPNEITSAHIVLRDVHYLEEVWGIGLMLHELGHVRGLGHSPMQSDIMCAYILMGPHALTDFSGRETIAMKIQNDRLAGTRPLDDDSAILAASPAVRVLEAGDPLVSPDRTDGKHTGPVTVDY